MRKSSRQAQLQTRTKEGRQRRCQRKALGIGRPESAPSSIRIRASDKFCNLAFSVGYVLPLFNQCGFRNACEQRFPSRGSYGEEKLS